jgi:ribose 5-phosphate isomerase B
MKVAITSDHAGYHLKQELIPVIDGDGHEIIDLGADSEKPVDYPDFALRIGLIVAGGEVDRGVFICGSGVGGCVVVNKIPGVRAGLCHDTYSAHQGVEHDNMNILCLGSRVIGKELAIEICRAFLNAEFTGEDRHVRRLAKLEEIEGRFCRRPQEKKP